MVPHRCWPVWQEHFVKVRTCFCSFNHCLMSAFKFKKKAPKCVFAIPWSVFVSWLSTKFSSAGSDECICVYLHSSPLFVHHPILLWVPYCLCLFSCSTHGSRTYCLFRRDSKDVVVFILCCLSFFPLLFSFLTHVFHHQPSCPQHNPAESYKMSILSKGGGETEQAW